MNWKKMFLIVVFVLSALSTLVPWPASKKNLLGYYSHCSFAPWSTLILIVVASCIYFYFQWRNAK